MSNSSTSVIQMSSPVTSPIIQQTSNNNVMNHKRSLNRQSQSCSVCGDRAYYVFYGAVACDSCRTFFRRQVLHSKTLSCHFKNSCQIQLNTRKDCAKCRLDKCLAVGMKQSLVAIGETDSSTGSNQAANHLVAGSNNSPAGSQTNQHKIKQPHQQQERILVMSPPSGYFNSASSSSRSSNIASNNFASQHQRHQPQSRHHSSSSSASSSSSSPSSFLTSPPPPSSSLGVSSIPAAQMSFGRPSSSPVKKMSATSSNNSPLAIKATTGTSMIPSTLPSSYIQASSERPQLSSYHPSNLSASPSTQSLESLKMYPPRGLQAILEGYQRPNQIGHEAPSVTGLSPASGHHYYLNTSVQESSSTSSSSNSPSCSPQNIPQASRHYHHQQSWTDHSSQEQQNSSLATMNPLMASSSSLSGSRGGLNHNNKREHYFDNHYYHSYSSGHHHYSQPVYHSSQPLPHHYHHPRFQQRHPSLDYAFISESGRLDLEEINSIRREAARRGSFQEPPQHYLHYHPNDLEMRQQQQQEETQKTLNTNDSEKVFHNRRPTQPEETPTASVAVKLHPKIALKNEHNRIIQRNISTNNNNNRQENDVNGEQHRKSSSSEDVTHIPVSSCDSKRKDSAEDVMKFNFDTKETSKTRIPSRMIHPKFRRATVTNLLVSCSDSKSGDVKDSVEIRNLSSTERERMIEIIQAAKQLEKEEEEALLSKVTNDSEDQKEDKEEDSEGGGSEILSLVKEQQEVSNDDKNVTSKDSQDTNNCNNVFFLEMLIYTSAKKVISVAQKLKPFQLLPESDKMSLLKGSIAEILFLRSTKVFDKESKCWRLPYSFKEKSMPQVIPMKVLEAADDMELHDKYQDFVDSFDETLANDSVLINLMCAICLFTEREGLIEKDLIRCERTLYLRLLQQYVNCKYQDRETNSSLGTNIRFDGKDLYESLLVKFSELSLMKEMYEKTTVDLDNVSSLVHPCRDMKISSPPPVTSTMTTFVPTTTTTNVSVICYPTSADA